MNSVLECALCDGQAEPQVEKREREFRKEKFLISEHYYKCRNCGEEFTTAEIDGIDILQVYNQYREKHKILFPKQITDIREKYGLSAPRMSEVLGFGINVYKSYEKGEVPNLSNATLLALIQSPEEFRRVAELKKELFEESEYKNLLVRIDSVGDKNNNPARELDIFWDDKKLPDEYTGFSAPSFEKFANMVVFFLGIAQFKVKLNKLLFYADFLNYKHNGYSISGAKYQAIQMGPVIYRYDTLFEQLKENGYVNNEPVLIQEEYCDKFSRVKEFDESVFSPEELDTLYRTYDKLKPLSRQELTDLSHEEKGWIEENSRRGLISYQKYAFEIKVL